jgi:hypothetical protein
MRHEDPLAAFGDPVDRRPATLNQASAREMVQRPRHKVHESGVGTAWCALGKIRGSERELAGEPILNLVTRPLLAIIQHHEERAHHRLKLWEHWEGETVGDLRARVDPANEVTPFHSIVGSGGEPQSSRSLGVKRLEPSLGAEP